MEHEVLREACLIALDQHTIEFRQLGIQNNSNASEDEDLWPTGLISTMCSTRIESPTAVTSRFYAADLAQEKKRRMCID